MAGINGGLMNIIFDCVPLERRSDSLAICQAVSGVIGFVTTLAVSPLISLIQQNGNHFLGLPVYAQQITAGISFVFILLTMLSARRQRPSAA